jgi:hypothetical protein
MQLVSALNTGDVTFILQSLHSPSEKNPLYPFNKKFYGPENQSEHDEEG